MSTQIEPSRYVPWTMYFMEQKSKYNFKCPPQYLPSPHKIQQQRQESFGSKVFVILRESHIFS